MAPSAVLAVAAAWALVPLIASAAAVRGAEKREIKVPGWPDLSAKAPLSAGILSRGHILASGMSGINMSTFKPVPGGVAAETTQALTLVRQIIEAGGGRMSDVTACAVYLRDIRDFAAVNEAYAAFFPKPRPARVAMEIAALAGPVTVEIQCVGALPDVPRREVVVPTWPDITDKFPFSTGIVSGDFVYASGAQGIDMPTGRLAPGGVRAETAQTLSNLGTVIEAAGASVFDIVHCAVYLLDLADRDAMNDAYTAFFSAGPRPSRVAVQVAALAGQAKVEIQCFAALPSAGSREVVVPGWPASRVLSSGIVAGGFLFASGLAGVDLSTGKLVPGGIAAETAQTLKLLQQVVEAGGSTMDDVVACTVYLRDMKDFAAMNQVYAAAFPKPPPARIASQIVALSEGASVEIQCTAAMPEARVLPEALRLVV